MAVAVFSLAAASVLSAAPVMAGKATVLPQAESNRIAADSRECLAVVEAAVRDHAALTAGQFRTCLALFQYRRQDHPHGLPKVMDIGVPIGRTAHYKYYRLRPGKIPMRYFLRQ